MDIDRSKENIQPLRGGRNQQQLGAALSAQTHADAQRTLQLQRQEHEALVESYDGPDPLEPWFNYIQWVEQSFPKRGHEGQIDKLIKECLARFESDERYSQDRRFLRLWIKYIDYSNAPLELYQLLYNRRVGTECTELYRAWACYCEEASDYAKAEQIYNLGLQRGAQPRDELEQAHASFQIWFAQRVLHDDSPTKRKAASALAETRLALTSLRTVKRRNTAAAPSQRTGDYVGDLVPGPVRQRFEPAERRPRGNVEVHVYDENPSTSALPVASQARQDLATAASLLQAVEAPDNQKEVGIWTNGSSAKSEKCAIAKKPAPLTFTVYEDDDLGQADDRGSRFDDRVPLCVPDPPDPNKISMYNKSEVYKETENGLVEFSPEEIRARLYVEAFENRRKAPNGLSPRRGDSDAPEPTERYDDVDEFNLERVIAQSNSLLNADGPAAADEFDYGACLSDEAGALPLVCIPSSSVYRAEEPEKNMMADFDRSLMANLAEGSMTVNTKEALRELDLFGGNDTVSIVPRMEPVKFDIREDHSMTMAAVRAKSADAPGLTAFRDLGVENPKMAPDGRLRPCGAANNLDNFEPDEFSTQMFTFELMSLPSSTPYSGNFKKPQPTKPCVRSFNLADCVDERSARVSEAPTPNALRPAADELYPIMETTQEYRSGSSSSGSNFITRNGAYGYPIRETLDAIDERSQDVNFNRGDGYRRYADPAVGEAQQTPGRVSDGSYTTVAGARPSGSPAAPYRASDHSYHKMSTYPNQQNGGYQSPVAPYQNYSESGFQAPHRSGEQPAYEYDSRHAMQTQAFQTSRRVRPEFQSPQRSSIQHGYQSPLAVYQNGQQEFPQNGYTVQQQRTYQTQTPVHAYPAYQSPVRHQSAYQDYQNASVRVSPSYAAVPQYQTPNHGYSPTAQPYQQQQQHHQQQQHRAAYSGQNGAATAYQHPQQYSVEISRQQAYYANGSFEARSYQGETSQRDASYEAQPQYGYARQFSADQARHNAPADVLRRQQQAFQSPTSKLRSVRHEAPHSSRAAAEASPSPGFRFGYRPNFAQSMRSKPEDDADVPKFNGGRSISQKMNKNLYVSSPEQAQMPPSSGIDDPQARGDQFKRQLDFERRVDVHSEDSRDSLGKESRPPRSRKSASDSLRMDVDENSSDALASKTDLSNSHVSTQDALLPARIDFPENVDPFNSDLCNSLLRYVKFPNKNHYLNYYETKTIPKLQQGALLAFDCAKFSVEKQLGKGTFGSVFRACDRSSGEPVALKYQKPGHRWEYYVCREIKARITDPYILPGFMDIRAAYFGDHASLFVSELSAYGSLLDVANRIKTATTKCISEFIVMFLAGEMLSIVHHLHKAGIVHADIKPDNFLVMKIPQTESRAPSLQLIDFGCAIDMTLFPEGTTFRKVISTDGFTCTEMRDGRPWTYQTDLYCLAGTVYVILMGNYMQTANRGGQWAIDKKWPRYMKSSIWDKVFGTLLNVPDCSTIPNLSELKETLDEFLRYEETTLTSQLRTFEHVLKCK